MSDNDSSGFRRPGDFDAFPSSIGYGHKVNPNELTNAGNELKTSADNAIPPPPPGGYAMASLPHPMHSGDVVPQLPRTIEETHLNPSFIAELLVKTLYFNGEMLGSAIADYVCLPFTGSVYPLLEQLKAERFVEVKGGGTTYQHTWKFALTQAGSNKVQEIMLRNQYCGPAPVALKDYHAMVNKQFYASGVTYEDVRTAFKDLVVADDLVEKVGSAVNSSKSIFLYGPPGNGKTSVAERICRMMRGSIYIPYAVEIHGQVIKLYDQLDHHPAEGGAKPPGVYDRRWVYCKRPLVIVGGELTLPMLDLTYNTSEKFYEAPFQLKSNGGMLLIDDFGRQLVHPKDLLNRWIVPLEKGIDYLTLHTGQKFEAPFRQLVVFSTNMNPRDLVDEAFLRRLRYKIEVADPTETNFRAIVKRVCESKGVAYSDEGLNYLVQGKYRKDQTPFRACHPRDLVEIILDKARFLKCAPTLDPSFIDMAWSAYFVKY